MFDINKESSNIEKTLADVMKLEKQKKEARISSAELEESSLKVALQLQTLTDAIQGGIRSANMREFPAVYVINASDSLDDSYPFLVPFNIISEMTKIISIKLSFWFLNFRAYAKSAKDGGGVVKSTSEGGADTRTTEDGGADTRTTEDGGSANPTSSYKTTPSGGGATTGYKGSASGGGSTSGGITSMGGRRAYAGASPSDPWLVGGSDHIIINDASFQALSGHSHTTPNHTHPNHYHTTPNHTHPQHRHTVTIVAHSHTVYILAHSHTVSILNHDHTVTLEDHSHEIVYGIYEEENSPTIQVFISRDKGLTYSLPLGSYTADQQLDITRFIDTAGDKMIKFESTTRARLGVQITIKLNTKVR